MDYLQNGIPVRYFVDGEERSSIVYLVDYKKIPTITPLSLLTNGLLLKTAINAPM